MTKIKCSVFYGFERSVKLYQTHFESVGSKEGYRYLGGSVNPICDEQDQSNQRSQSTP
jgi:hypothetical protein